MFDIFVSLVLSLLLFCYWSLKFFFRLIQLVFPKSEIKRVPKHVAIIMPSENVSPIYKIYLPIIRLFPSYETQVQNAIDYLEELGVEKITIFATDSFYFTSKQKLTVITKDFGRNLIINSARCNMDLKGGLENPDLLMVPYPTLKLHGFPPLQLETTEIYHEQATMLLSMGFISRALNRYQNVQQRFGK